MTFYGETENFSGKNGTLRRSIFVGKEKRNIQKPTSGATKEPPPAVTISPEPE